MTNAAPRWPRTGQWPPVDLRLFAWAPAGRVDARRRTRSAQVAVTAAPLPRDVFKLVISFWRPNREWWWSSHTYSRVNRYDAPLMG